MNIDEIRKRLAECPIPEDAVADWKNTNLYEITTSARTAKDAAEYWWLDNLDEALLVGSKTVEGKRLGAVLDYAVAYRRDVGALLGEIDKVARRCAQIADNYIGAGVAGATIRREFKL